MASRATSPAPASPVSTDKFEIGSPPKPEAAAVAASGPEDVQDAINAMKALLDMVMKENKLLKERLDEVQGAGGGHGGGQAPNAAGGQAIDPLTGTGDPWRGQSPGQSPPGPPGMASPTPAILPPKAPERKDVEGPAKYGGNPDEWLA